MTVAIDVKNRAVLDLLAALEQMKLVRTLSRREREALAVEDFDATYPDDVPNLETLAAIQEAEDIINGRVKAKTYHSAEELHDEIEAEMRAGEDEEECAGAEQEPQGACLIFSGRLKFGNYRS